MCGIVGYIGDNAVDHVLNGLKSLEYRGYDSVGEAFLAGGKLHVIKDEGRVSNLESQLPMSDDIMLAIGHTRWATTGSPTPNNAHPHRSGKYAVVHNGIIENYRGLKACEMMKNREFASETDTEIVAHLIDVASGGRLFEKVCGAVGSLEGSYALAVISESEPDTIVVARKQSPLVIGVWDGGAVVASDIHAVLPHTNRIIVLSDDDIGVVKPNSIEIFNSGRKVEREALEIPWSSKSAGKEGFETFMDKEIHEQPVAIYDTMTQNNWEEIATNIYDIFDHNVITSITLTACGTSLHASMIMAILIEKHVGIPARARLASELEASGAVLENSLVVVTSQSGETMDSLKAIWYAKKQGAVVLSIVNVLGSSIERESDYTIYTYAGPEVSVASTKSYVSQLAVLYMLSMIIRSVFCGDRYMFDLIQEDIYTCAKRMQDIFDQEEQIKEIAYNLANSHIILYIGRGLQVPTALEGALKLKEISYISADGMAAGELKHGTLALVGSGTPVIVLAINGESYSKIVINIEEVKSRGAKVIAIATVGNEKIKNMADDVIYMPDVAEDTSVILSVVPLQILAMYAAEALGREIDMPKNLAKCVSVE